MTTQLLVEFALPLLHGQVTVFHPPFLDRLQRPSEPPLGGFLRKIEAQYGKADRIRIMDRGISTEEIMQQMRESDPPVSYLVGTPKGRLTKLEQNLLDKPWHSARPMVKVKLLPHEGETYVLAQSEDRIAKERSMRRRRLRKYLKALADLTNHKGPLKRDEFHQALGAAKKEAGRDARHVKVEVTLHGQGKTQTATLSYRLDRHKLRVARRREGRYLLRTNMTDTDPVRMWEYYLQLTEIEQAFKEPHPRSRHRPRPRIEKIL